MENEVSETADHERIWWRSALRKSWRPIDAMDRGIPGKCIPTSGGHVEENSFPARHLSLDLDGFPLPTPAPAWETGLPQPKGIDLGPGRKEKGVLRNAEILSRDGSNITKVAAV